MPLSFQTLNRGTIAFGFFNIDSDLLLMDRFFLFAPEFCDHVGDLAEDPGLGVFEAEWEVDVIEDQEAVGDLMGAIHNIRHVGFIGEVYRRYPFPSRPEAFRQKPEGYRTREEIREILDRYAVPAVLPFAADPESGEIVIGPFRFSRQDFLELVQYVWMGGYPRWRGMERPDYVSALKGRIERSRNPVFEGVTLA
ncbi:MAG: hypothetical protein K9M82_02435 [Deltaproteobacteria bacterium]|nr:hypothetical protein [Deltaproteobacteria bacterium]